MTVRETVLAAAGIVLLLAAAGAALIAIGGAEQPGGRCLRWERVTYPGGAYSCWPGRKFGSPERRRCGVDVETRVRVEGTQRSP